MTKHDLVVRISDKLGVSQVQANQTLETLFEAITESLSRNERVELRNFGIFEVRRRKARIGRNPANPVKEYEVPARLVVKFKAGKEMANVVRKAGGSRKSAT